MYEPDQNKTIHKLLELLGEEECLRLGFLGKDDNATLFLTIIGTGYLVEVRAGGIDTLHEAYAAGYKQGHAQCKDGF